MDADNCDPEDICLAYKKNGINKCAKNMLILIDYFLLIIWYNLDCGC